MGEQGGARLWTSLGPIVYLGAQSLPGRTFQSFLMVEHPEGSCVISQDLGDLNTVSFQAFLVSLQGPGRQVRHG